MAPPLRPGSRCRVSFSFFQILSAQAPINQLSWLSVPSRLIMVSCFKALCLPCVRRYAYLDGTFEASRHWNCISLQLVAGELMHSETTHSRVRGQASWLGPNLLNGLGAKLLAKAVARWRASPRRAAQNGAVLCTALLPRARCMRRTNPARARLRSGRAVER